jgi:hypothetical protein
MLESAIPEYLRVPRTQPLNTPPSYEPPFPAYTARFPQNIKDIVMVVIGAQSFSILDKASVAPLLSIVQQEVDSKPSYWEPTSVKDSSGAHNIAVIAYWQSKEAYLKWCSASGFDEWWASLDPEAEQHGWFREVFVPPVERFETVFSDNVKPEGAAHMREKISGPIQEHVYWGSMRDRLAATQTDSLVGEMQHTEVQESNAPAKQRIRIPGKQNLCIIRSGQDWSDTRPEERKLYLNTMHPVLTKGMTFLRDHGGEVGCYSCRFMEVLDLSTLDSGTDKTFGLAFFNDLSSLESWSREHKTHLDIFGGFLKYARELKNNISLRLFHEVLVLQPDQQLFEYINCHPGTGMLVT